MICIGKSSAIIGFFLAAGMNFIFIFAVENF